MLRSVCAGLKAARVLGRDPGVSWADQRCGGKKNLMRERLRGWTTAETIVRFGKTSRCRVVASGSVVEGPPSLGSTKSTGEEAMRYGRIDETLERHHTRTYGTLGCETRTVRCRQKGAALVAKAFLGGGSGGGLSDRTPRCAQTLAPGLPHHVVALLF